MDYVDDDCMFIFTQDQVNVMIATAAAQNQWAVNSISCAVTYPPCADQAGACNATACASVDLEILFDGFPGQTSWDITDANGAVVASGGSYGSQPGNSALNTNPACLPDGCYDLNFYDSINNGMCPFQSTASGLSTFITPGTLIAPGTIVGTLALGISPGLCGNYTLTDPNGGVLASGGGGFGASQTNSFCLVGGVAPKISDPNSENQVSKFIDESGFQVIPTVTTGIVTIQYAKDLNGQLKILDLSGKTLQEFSLSNQLVNHLNIDITEEKTGVYFAQIITNRGKVETKKFLKK